MDSQILILAVSVGLFSAFHCLGMCGGIIGALSMSLPPQIQHNRWQLFPYVLTYNLGRLTSYALAGALMAGLGSGLFDNLSPRFGHLILQWIAALFMIGFGLYLAGWFPRFARLETLGRPLWRAIEPQAKRLLPVKTPLHALFFGLLWGWLPCGLVYTALIFSSTAGSATDGALFMTIFGIGTFPATLTAGMLTAWLARLTRQPAVRRLAGISIIVLAVATLLVSISADDDHSGHFGPLHHHKHE